MTSNHSPEVVEQSKQAGAIACLAKPLDVQQVLELFRIPLALGTKK
jgi:AmiR/NasT family two-component response regulator